MNRFKNKATADAHFEKCFHLVDKISEIIAAEGDEDADAEVILFALGAVCGAVVRSCNEGAEAFALLMKSFYARTMVKEGKQP